MKKQMTCKNIFPNISRFFTIKNLVKLLTTLIITFYLRSYIVILLDLDYSCLKDLLLFSILYPICLLMYIISEFLFSLDVELSATPLNLSSSSLVTENNSVASNIHELGQSTNVNNTPIASRNTSLVGVNGSIASDIHELDGNRSIGSSMLDQDGSVLSEPNDSGMVPAMVYSDGIGFLAPDSALHPGTYDTNYSDEYVHREGGIIDRIKSSYKSMDEKLERQVHKYYSVGNRKIYWEIWGKKRNNTYSSYGQFKRDWDPNTNAFKKIYSEGKDAFKNEFRESLKDIRTISSSTNPLDQLRRINRRRR